jgi:hypothetical protein
VFLWSVVWFHSLENKALNPVDFGGTGNAILVRAINLSETWRGTTGIERAVAYPEAHRKYFGVQGLAVDTKRPNRC